LSGQGKTSEWKNDSAINASDWLPANQGLGKLQTAEQTRSNNGKHDGSSHALLIGQCEMPSVPQIFFAFRNVVHAGSGGNRFETSK
jgi:hypothetical protein